MSDYLSETDYYEISSHSGLKLSLQRRRRLSDNLSETDFYEISSHSGLKLSLQRRRRLSNCDDGPSLSQLPSDQPARKRQRLSGVLHADLSSSFRPALSSTMNLQLQNVSCPPRPVENTVDTTLLSNNVSQVSRPSWVETTEEHVDNVIEPVTELPVDTSVEDSGPSWDETPEGIRPSAEQSIIDPVRRCHLELHNQQEPYYFLARGGTQNNKDCIIQLPAGYTFIRDNILKKTGRLAWRCIDSKKKNGPGCNCRITTPVDYDDQNEPDERKVDLQVQGSTIHLCNPNGAAYVAIRLKREQIRLGLQDHFRTAREIVDLTMAADYEPVGLSADMPRALLPSLENMERLINLHRAPQRAVNPNKETVADFEIKMTDPSAVDFVRVSLVTENKTKKGEIQ